MLYLDVFFLFCVLEKLEVTTRQSLSSFPRYLTMSIIFSCTGNKTLSLSFSFFSINLSINLSIYHSTCLLVNLSIYLSMSIRFSIARCASLCLPLYIASHSQSPIQWLSGRAEVRTYRFAAPHITSPSLPRAAQANLHIP